MRRLNAVTELPSYPIPKIADVLEGLNGSSMFSTLDMNMAYYQVKINPEHQQRPQLLPRGKITRSRLCASASPEQASHVPGC